MLIFVEEGKPENPEKNPRSKDENQQQTQPTYDPGCLATAAYKSVINHREKLADLVFQSLALHQSFAG